MLALPLPHRPVPLKVPLHCVHLFYVHAKLGSLARLHHVWGGDCQNIQTYSSAASMPVVATAFA